MFARNLSNAIALFLKMIIFVFGIAIIVQLTSCSSSLKAQARRGGGCPMQYVK